MKHRSTANKTIGYFSSVSLRSLLIVPFVLQITLAVGLTGWLSIRNGEQAVNEAVSQLREQIRDRIDQKLNEFLATSHLVNTINQNVLELGYVDPKNLEELYRYFYSQTDDFQSVESIFFGDVNGEFIGSTHFNNDRQQLMIAGQETRGNIRFYDVDAAGNPQQMVRESLNFDPRNRPWYQAAVEAQQPTWGQVFTYQAYPLMALPAVSPVYSETGELIGVLGNNFFLSDISDFLRTLEVGKTGETFIIESSGELIASSTDQEPFKLTAKGTERINLLNSEDPLLQATAQFLHQQYGNFDQINNTSQLEFKFQDQRHFVEVTPYQDQWGLDWLIIVVIPEADFLAQIHANNRTTVLLCFGSLLIAVGVGILTAQKITHPLLRLNKAAKKVTQGDFQQTVVTQNPREIKELANSFTQMTSQLQASFGQMRKLNEALAASESRLQEFLEALPVGVVVYEHTGKLIYMNQVGKKLFQLEQVPSITIRESAPTYQLYKATTDKLYASEEMPAFLALQGQTTHVDDLELRQGGLVIPLEAWATPIYNSQQVVEYAIVAFQNVTERKQHERQLIYNARHDQLTDLPNRHFLLERLDLVIDHLREQRGFAVLFLDLDNFKVINDSLGHLIGDQVLIKIAQKLKAISPTDKLVARLGGDEFVIVLEDVAGVEEATRLAQQIIEMLQKPLPIQGKTIFTGTSIGIVMGHPHYQNATELLRNADIAMYRAKLGGRGRYEVFDEAMHVQVLQRLVLENDLRRAITNEEFVVYYQPIVTMTTQEIIGFEALVRWQHPQKGLIPPGKFIPVAEETGLILPMTRWLLRAVCQQLVQWRRQFPQLPQLKVSLNLSGHDLQDPSLIDELDAILAQTGLDCRFLTLEVTEGMLVKSLETATALLKALRSRGIQISIDDFGTGYSSLSYLYHLPVDNLKIDRSFVNSMKLGSRNYRIVETIITLSNHLELSAIAEGIETPQQLQWLQQLGCEYGQGYLFSRPVPSDAATQLLTQGSLAAMITG